MRKTSNVFQKFLLSVALLLCCTALANAKNPNAYEIDGIYYILDDENNTATVTWGGVMKGYQTEEYSGDIVIPEKVGYYTVTSIGESAFEGSSLTSITIPSSVTSIGNNAFARCPELKSVYVSWKAPLAISDNVFYGLSTSEITLHVPYGTLDAYRTANVWSTFNINDEAVHFADANAEAISIENWDSNHDGHLSYEEAAAVTDLGDAFSNSTITSFNELKYFKNLTSIGDNAFKGTSITSIEIPTTITSIGNSAFENCRNLKSVTIPATITSIGENAFKGCSGLEEIYVKVQNPLSINSNVFENAATTCLLRVPYGSVLSYEEADVWKDFSNIQDNAIHFEDPAVEAICLANWDTNKDGVLTYEEATAVKDLEEVFRHNTTITSFSELKHFTGITTMWWEFSGCTNLKEITIPNGVTYIDSYTFQNCTNLVSITIPNSVTSIGSNAIYVFTNLQNVNINIVDFANNNIIYDYFGTSKTIKYYYNGEEISGELTIPSTAKAIGNNALKGATGLTSVTIPNSVTAIGSGAFNGCTGLTSVAIPSSVTAIGSNAFEACTGLTSVTIPNSVTSIGEEAFYGCIGLTSVTIPSSVTSIGSNAFEGCTELETVSVQWTEADKIPDISGKNVFNGIALSDVTLDIPYKKGNIRSLYTAKDVWKDFNIDFAKNFFITKSGNTTIEQKASENSEIALDESTNDVTKLLVIEDVTSVKSITYKRDFTNVAGKWQAWFVPFEAPVDVLDDAGLDAAEVAGILLNSEGETIVAFKMIDGSSKKMHANTPYVVRMRSDADSKIATLVFENTNLKETAESEYYAMSMYDKFTFTGNYEFRTIDDSYTLNTDGEFQMMKEGVKLKPMRFSLSISSRDDSPYEDEIPNSASRPAIRYMILDDDSSLQPIDDENSQQETGEKTMRAMTPAITLKPRAQKTFIYDLRGRKVNNIQSKQVYIINGKNYIAK